MAVSFDLFGTLVRREYPEEPAVAIGEALEARGVTPPPDWVDTYGAVQRSIPDEREVPLQGHVCMALERGGVECDIATVRDAVLAALDPVVEPREGAQSAVRAARGKGPVGLCTNCRMPEFVGLSLARAGIDPDSFDTCVSSAGCGWRKPAPQIFTTVADRLDVTADRMTHVGASQETDGGIESVGGTILLVEDRPLREIAEELDSH